MINIQEEAQRIEAIKDAMQKIESDITLSFHHYSIELGLPVEDIQRAWAKYSYKKRKGKQ